MEMFILFFVFAVGAVILSIAGGSMDRDRVGSYLRQRGGRLISAKWSPFGRGWFGEKNDRIYEVRYSDRDGNIHRATAKTSMFSGVYFTDDQIVQKSLKVKPVAEAESSMPTKATQEELEQENARLRARIAELERRDVAE